MVRLQRYDPRPVHDPLKDSNIISDSSVSRRSDPERSVVSSAAYLLFYRRRPTPPNTILGGPFFEELFSASSDLNNPNDSDSTPNSRQTSPSGEGRLVDSSSRNGSSSGSHGVGRARQREVGGGGLGGVARSGNNNSSEELPGYEEEEGGPGLQVVNQQYNNNISLDDEGVGDMEDDDTQPITGIRGLASYHRDEPNWSFEHLGHNHEDEYEDDPLSTSYPTGPSSMRGMSRPLTQQDALAPTGGGAGAGAGYHEDENLFEGEDDDDDNASVGRAPSSRSDAPGMMDASDDEEEVEEGAQTGEALKLGTPPQRGNNSPVVNGAEGEEEEHIPFLGEAHALRGDEDFPGEEGEEEEDKVVDIRIDGPEGDDGG